MGNIANGFAVSVYFSVLESGQFRDLYIGKKGTTTT